MESALEKLRKENLITQTKNSRKIILSSTLAIGRTYELAINYLSISSGNKWRAQLASEDYEGLRTLIKKNSRFRTVARLYQVEGILCVQVKKITEMMT